MTAVKKVFIGNTSAVTAYCQIKGEKENIVIAKRDPFISCGLPGNICMISPIRYAESVVKQAEDKLTLYATDPIVEQIFNKYTNIVNKGYPGGWAIPNVQLIY